MFRRLAESLGVLLKCLGGRLKILATLLKSLGDERKISGGRLKSLGGGLHNLTGHPHTPTRVLSLFCPVFILGSLTVHRSGALFESYSLLGSLLLL